MALRTPRLLALTMWMICSIKSKSKSKKKKKSKRKGSDGVDGFQTMAGVSFQCQEIFLRDYCSMGERFLPSATYPCMSAGRAKQVHHVLICALLPCGFDEHVAASCCNHWKAVRSGLQSACYHALLHKRHMISSMLPTLVAWCALCTSMSSSRLDVF